jgi:hypothetical protein
MHYFEELCKEASPMRREPGNVLGVEVEVLPPAVVEEEELPAVCDHEDVDDRDMIMVG